MRITERRLRSLIRKIIEEGSSFSGAGEKKIKSLIDERLMSYLESGYRIDIHSSKHKVIISLKKGEDFALKTEGDVHARFVMNSNANKTGLGDKTGIGEGESYPVWIIRRTEATKGIGPIFYELAIEFLGKTFDAGLKPDNASVSDDARGVWERYYSRAKSGDGSLKLIDLDITPREISKLGFYKGLKDLKVKNKTEKTEDDTSQLFAIKDKKAEIAAGDPYAWFDSVFAKGYKKTEFPVLDYLEEYIDYDGKALGRQVPPPIPKK